jgi:hypothetical protein
LESPARRQRRSPVRNRDTPSLRVPLTRRFQLRHQQSMKYRGTRPSSQRWPIVKFASRSPDPVQTSQMPRREAAKRHTARLLLRWDRESQPQRSATSVAPPARAALGRRRSTSPSSRIPTGDGPGSDRSVAAELGAAKIRHAAAHPGRSGGGATQRALDPRDRARTTGAATSAPQLLAHEFTAVVVETRHLHGRHERAGGHRPRSDQQ